MNSLAAESEKTLDKSRVVNDFSIHVATINGSGSQSSNNVLMRSIFQMGIPVSGKNLFPSNIAGLPTWFTIRVNKNGYIGRKHEIDILVAMNPQTAFEDVKSLPAGAVCVSPVELKLDTVRSDVHHYQVPFADLAAQATDQIKLRKLLTNMIYVGVVGELISLDFKEVETAIANQFLGKQKAIDLNIAAVNKGREWAKENLKKTDPFVVERLNLTKGKIIIDGNAAAAIGCVFAGVSVVTWYPITPSSSLAESLQEYLEQHRKDKDGKATFAVIQAEDELAAIGMALGAGWAGARSMTTTSGPGISLMSEFVGLGYFSEIPAVIFDVQRVGPSTGMPTRTAQQDLFSAYQLSHGDTKHIVLLPGSVEDCYTMAMEAFDLSERFQTPVFVLSDLDIGMNNWMADPFPYPTKDLDRGKVLTAEQLNKLGVFERYKD
ncbi:MAG: 2-oxoacid:acceptor oxidoreductase family protein, partial [Candidatus Obscuribacterales bacterium]|nr:2-oxoacid:acceptor oxidoreductase family protein [Candidatus Obscuribacterales bacterium]